MDIKEKAKNYAEGKALEAITSAIEEAYAKGYKDGYNDGYNNKDKINPIEVVDGVKYVDLDLPSGKKWSFECLIDTSDRYKPFKKFTYEEASKLNIPTKEDFLELINHCKLKGVGDGTKAPEKWNCISKNGEFIKLQKTKAVTGSDTLPFPSFVFWLKDGSQEGDERLCANGYASGYLGKVYMGYKLPVMLVK